MRVLKFGGSSVADAGCVSRTLDIIEKVACEDRVVAVCSAISGCTDKLIELGARCAAGDFAALDIISELKDRHFKIILRLFSGNVMRKAVAELDDEFNRLTLLAISILNSKAISEKQATEIQTFGELFSTRILAAKLKDEFFEVRWTDSRELIVKDDVKKTFSNIRRKISSCRKTEIFVAPGFIAKDAEGNVTTLGRGGSDYSGALFAAALDSPAVEIWTDVPGIMTANPKIVPSAKNIPHLSYDAAFSMASHGAKVLYAPTVLPVKEKGIPIEIRNTFDPDGPYTLIDGKDSSGFWEGISSVRDGDYENIYLTAGCRPDPLWPERARQTQLRIIAALKDAGISAVETGEGEGFVSVSVLERSAREACITLHNEFF